MITRERNAEGAYAVTFRPPPEMGGDTASVVGDFNGWDPAADPFLSDGQDKVVTLHLPAGRYRFRYLTNSGRWFNDPEADAYEANEYGGADGVLTLAPLDMARPNP